MYRKILTAVMAVAILGLCGCAGSPEKNADNETSTQYSVYGTEDGEVVYDLTGGKQTEEVGGKLVERNGNTTEVSAPDGSISIEKAAEIVDTCAFEPFYLPTKTADYQKYYYGTIDINDKKYYSMCFYLEKNSVRMYAGTDFLVSCDGKDVMKKDWTGTWQDVEIGSSSEDPSAEELYKDAETTPEEALFVLNEIDPEKLGLTEKLYSYTFEIDAKLYTKKSIRCYRITPKLVYENGVVLGESIYVTADGTNRVMMYRSETDDYEQIK